MNRYSPVCCLALATVLVVAYPSPGIAQTPAENAEARRLFNEGVEFQHSGNLVEAEKKLREALRKYPKAEQADKTAYYLIDTLDKLRRVPELRIEIDNFRKNYPQSRWLPDVNEKITRFGGQPAPPSELSIWNSPAELREAQALADRLRGAITPAGPPDKIYNDEFPANASYNALVLQMLIRSDQVMGLDEAKRMLKNDPSDPAVAANLGTIANYTDSRLAVEFLLSVWGNTATRQNVRNSALFWVARRNPNKEEVAKAIMDLLSKKETEGVASEALYRLTVADHRAVLEKIVMSSNAEKFSAIEKIYRNGSTLLRTDLLNFVNLLNDPKAESFLLNAAQNDRDLSVRRTAVQLLGTRKGVDAETLQALRNSLSAPRPVRPTTTRLPQGLPFTGSGISILPLLPADPR